MALASAVASFCSGRALALAPACVSSSGHPSSGKVSRLASSSSCSSSILHKTQCLPVISRFPFLRPVEVCSQGFHPNSSQAFLIQKKLKTSLKCSATATEAEAEAPEAPAETYEYQAEVSRLMDLIVHSLYSNKEVFLRELVSNASDALDKLRFLSVTEPGLLAANPNLDIRIKTDNSEGTIIITDSGIGMTREELVDSLGTIAQSGTAKFVKAIKETKEGNSSDNNLIGQFGVGFYSAFLVADKVTVSTKSPKSDKQYVWEGQAEVNSYIIREETDPEKFLSRGTSITLHLKADDKFEYTSQEKIKNLVKNYSQFISFPIYTWQQKTRTKETEEESTTDSEEADTTLTDDSSKEKKVETETYYEWELVNESKPIWMRNPKEVTKEEYNSFCKSTFKEFVDPLAYTHFSTEGEIEFRSVLFTPGMAPFSGEEMYSGKPKNIRLYVKRVFISDEFEGELFPRYFGFVKGVIDSNDLPLNVSREILQESRIVRIMKKRLVRKTFDMIEEIASRENKEDYKTFWTNFGKNIKLGCIEDSGNHSRLAPLVRFYSSKHEEELTSLTDYVENMKEDQKAIYYLASETVKSAKSAPFLEELSKRDYEVLFLVEPVDEVAITNLQTFKDKKFVDISKEDLDLGENDEEKEKEIEKEYRLLCDWMKQNLGDKVAKVQVSKRVSSSPCILVSGKFGWSANMERIMKAQTLGDVSQLEFMRGRRILEINSNHPIIQDLNNACKNTPRNSKVLQLLELLYETALLSSGFTPENPAEFGARVYEMMALALTGKESQAYGAPNVVLPEADVEDEENEEDEEDEDEGAAANPEVVEPSEVRTENDPWKS